MSWKNKLPKEGSSPEENVWGILNEMGLKWEPNVDLDRIPANPSWEDLDCEFSAYTRHVDVLVENVLGIEVQSHGSKGLKLHDGLLRQRKDSCKHKSIEALGLGWLALWDNEISKAVQVKAGKLWMPKVKEAISLMLPYSKDVHSKYVKLWESLPEPPMIDWPGVGLVRIDRRRE